MTSASAADIGRMYDESAELSQMFIDGQEHLPYFYGDHDDTPIIEAARRITRMIGTTLGLRSGEHILDAGCGVGAPAIQLAEEFGVTVTGITVSSKQVEQARQRAAGAGAGAGVSVEFHQGDFASLAFADGTFDAVVAIESLMHADDLATVLTGFHRVLRPGGRLVVADCTREAGMVGERVEEFKATFGIGQLLSTGEWIDRLQLAGLQVEEHTQCGPRVYGMGLRYLDRADEINEELVQRFGADAIGALRSSYRDYFSWGSAVGYAILCARKPYL